MADTWHVQWLKEGSQHWNTRRKAVSFRPDLSGLDFRIILKDEHTSNTFFDCIDLKYANLEGAKLDGISFAGAQFYRSNLSNASMEDATFNGAKFNQSKLKNVSATNSSFLEAEFRGADLSRANFENTAMDDADFERSNLQTLQAEKFESYHRIKIPVTMAIPKHWDLRNVQHPLGNRISTVVLKAEDLISSVDMLAYHSTENTMKRLVEGSLRRLDAKTKAIYQVFFATNRNPIRTANRVVDYGTTRSGELDFGICNVGIPKGHKVGSIGSNLWKRLVRGDDRLKLIDLIQLNENLFWEHIKSCLSKASDPIGPTLFIHGYNTSFADAAIRAAQIGFDLGIGNGIGLYSWPSAGTMRSYSADEAAMEASKYLLADYIQSYVEKSGTARLNIVAHSMGCRCFLLATEVLARDRLHILERIGQVVLAAADVDQGIMAHLGAHAVGSADRITNYVSHKDYALSASNWLHSFPRVGLTPPTYVMLNMDTVLVNSFDLLSLGHGYVANSRKVLSDIFDILRHNLPPTERFTVEEIATTPLSHWQIKV